MSSQTTNPAVEEAIPAVLAGHALRSRRHSGYTLPAALGEVIDNALEADANQILIRLDDSGGKRSHITRIAVADDGSGMGTDEAAATSFSTICSWATRRATCARTRSGSSASAPSSGR